MIESAEFAGKLVVTIGFVTVVCGSAVIIRDVLQGVHPGRLAISVTYSGWSLAFVGAGMIVSVTVWPETLLVGLPFIAFGLWVASRGRSVRQLATNPRSRSDTASVSRP